MTIAQFGRGLRFAQPSPFPVWSRGAARIFPNALGWADLNASGVVTIDFTGPFLDLQSPMRITVALDGNLLTIVNRRQKLRTEIDGQGLMPSTRISKDSTDY